MLATLSTYAVHGFEIAGIGAIVIGSALATVAFLRGVRGDAANESYRVYRQRLGQAILLGLELLVAAVGLISGLVGTYVGLQNRALLAEVRQELAELENRIITRINGTYV